MSKIVERLNRHFKQKTSTDDFIQDELSKTFFNQSPRTRRVAVRNSKAPYVIAGVSLVLALLLIIFRSNIEVKVIITRNASVAPAGTNVFFLKGAEPNKELIRDTYFSGDARRFSRRKKDLLVLVNSKGTGWADFSIEFKKPIDMRKFDISYNAKGQVGNEYLAPVLVSADNSSYRMEKRPLVGSRDEWQEYVTSPALMANAIDLKKISAIRFEFGSLTTGNEPYATIFLKDIKAVKRKGGKWL